MSRIVFLSFIFLPAVYAAIQLDASCLERPQACDDDAFSVADFLLCSGDAFGTPVDGAQKGTGLVTKGCGFTEVCTMVYPADEINNDTWTTNASAGCDHVVWRGLNPTNDASLVADKKAACQKWFSADVGVCTEAIWWPITLVVVIILAAVGLVLLYLLKNPDSQPDFMKNLLTKKVQEYKPVPRGPREFSDGI